MMHYLAALACIGFMQSEVFWLAIALYWSVFFFELWWERFTTRL